MLPDEMPTGALLTRERKGGKVMYEAKRRDSTRTQRKRTLGRAWLEPDGDGNLVQPRGRIRPGFLDERRAHVAMAKLIAEHEEEHRPTRACRLQTPRLVEACSAPRLLFERQGWDSTHTAGQLPRDSTRGRGESPWNLGRLMLAAELTLAKVDVAVVERRPNKPSSGFEEPLPDATRQLRPQPDLPTPQARRRLETIRIRRGR
jgi:hypothetical protein